MLGMKSTSRSERGNEARASPTVSASRESDIGGDRSETIDAGTVAVLTPPAWRVRGDVGGDVGALGALTVVTASTAPSGEMARSMSCVRLLSFPAAPLSELMEVVSLGGGERLGSPV